MVSPNILVIASLIAYAFGSLPFGLLTARFGRGIDIREHGSGNIGATNVARVLGAKWGLGVLLLDALKGMLPVLLVPSLFVDSEAAGIEHLRVVCGIAAIVGHMYPCWLRFRGGKGVATALGVIVPLAPVATLWAVGVFAASFGITRIVSLSSMLASCAFAGSKFWMLQPHPFSSETWSLAVFSLLVPVLIILRHRTNVVRLLRGEESRFRTGVSKGGASGSDESQSIAENRDGSQPGGDDQNDLEGGSGSENPRSTKKDG